jgi:hypothetical protein
MLRSAIRLSLLLIFASSAIAEGIEGWADVPTDRSAIAVYLPDTSVQVSLVALDGAGNTFDVYNWDASSLPLVRQYRVPPGEYRILLEGSSGVLLADAKAGQISFIEARAEPTGGFDIALKPNGFDPIKAGLIDSVGTIAEKFGYEYVAPLDFAPAKNELYIKLMPGPGVKPPPPPPKNG